MNEKWLNLLSDEERAGVMKVQISETENTMRERIKQEEATKRGLHERDGFWWIRALFAIASVVGVITTGIVAHRYVEAKENVETLRLKAEHPNAFPVTPAPAPVQSAVITVQGPAQVQRNP